MYPNHEGMGDIEVTNFETDQIGIIDGTNFGINEVRSILSSGASCEYFYFIFRHT